MFCKPSFYIFCLLFFCCYFRWETPVLLPRKSHGWRRLVGCSPLVAQSPTRLKRLRSSSSRSENNFSRFWLIYFTSSLSKIIQVKREKQKTFLKSSIKCLFQKLYLYLSIPQVFGFCCHFSLLFHFMSIAIIPLTLFLGSP